MKRARIFVEATLVLAVAAFVFVSCGSDAPTSTSKPAGSEVTKRPRKLGPAGQPLAAAKKKKTGMIGAMGVAGKKVGGQVSEAKKEARRKMGFVGAMGAMDSEKFKQNTRMKKKGGGNFMGGGAGKGVKKAKSGKRGKKSKRSSKKNKKKRRR